MKPLSEIKGMRNIPTSLVRKISSMPRTVNSRKDYLELYVLAKEKSRMQQELEMLEGKRDNLLKNLTFIERKMAEYQEFVNNNANVPLPSSAPDFEVSNSNTSIVDSDSQVANSNTQAVASDFQNAAFQTQIKPQNKENLTYDGKESSIDRTSKKKGGLHFAKPSLYVRVDRRK